MVFRDFTPFEIDILEMRCKSGNVDFIMILNYDTWDYLRGTERTEDSTFILIKL